MARGKKRAPSDVDQRSYCLMLYPDNIIHMRAFHRIQKRYKEFYLGAWHLPEPGLEHKKHLHLVFRNRFEMRWETLSRKLGLDWDDKLGSRFLRPVGYSRQSEEERKVYTYRGALLYLTHANSSEKIQYSPDILFGSEDMRLLTLKYIREETTKRISCSEALDAVRAWLYNRRFKVVTSFEFLGWFLTTPYQPYLQNRWIFELINDHNREAYNYITGNFRPVIEQSSWSASERAPERASERASAEEELLAHGIGVLTDEEVAF